jgi:hypothetical protein
VAAMDGLVFKLKADSKQTEEEKEQEKKKIKK